MIREEQSCGWLKLYQKQGFFQVKVVSKSVKFMRIAFKWFLLQYSRKQKNFQRRKNMKTTVPNRASGEHKKIIMIILIIIALVAIIAALIFNLTGKNKNKADGGTQTFTETDSGLQTKEPLDSSTGNNETGAPVAEDTQTQPEALILSTVQPFANGDIEALKNRL